MVFKAFKIVQPLNIPLNDYLALNTPNFNRSVKLELLPI